MAQQTTAHVLELTELVEQAYGHGAAFAFRAATYALVEGEATHEAWSEWLQTIMATKVGWAHVLLQLHEAGHLEAYRRLP